MQHYFNFLYSLSPNQFGDVVDFTGLSDVQKKAVIIYCFMSTCNMNSLNPGETLDWSKPNMQIHVNSNLVLSLLAALDFDRICQRLVGQMSVQEIFAVVFWLLSFSKEKKKVQKMADDFLSCFEKWEKKEYVDRGELKKKC